MRSFRNTLVTIIVFLLICPLYPSAFIGETHVGISQESVSRHISGDEGN